ncbi:MAG: hypothetical protein CVU00_03410 [Bacteroidetes bacterium HGW-Bacteroidetes-17]|jgi:Na+-transporting methylmalonyl-CoA/oxaloacetate decarboxylase gamma subunit|nr:MAG: hypothetical protein CVU00_03410 [Bacteroidetes bacterium HGW-Bacteroidetes-17]
MNTFLSINIPESLPEGIVITLVGYSIVFGALVILYFVFSTFSKILTIKVRERLRREGRHEIANLPNIDITGEETAAISMALYLFNELHDLESNIITIKKISRTNSQWGAKQDNISKFQR